ncbi:MAG: recombinase family protein, partial [Phenylobacterium sp.]|nr:recombinase family protein [Phenylobacterium sp.]
MLRAALYARYSTGNQSPLSTDAQLRLCRRKAEEIGAHVVREFLDPEISGFVSGGRPQYQALLAFARSGQCDVVICEHSNRMARDGEAGWHVFHLFKRLGVRYVTVQESDMTVMSQAISTLMSEHKGEEVSQFTRRGLHQVVEDGRSAGGLSYGYKVRIEYDEKGERRRGLLEIDEAQAAVVRRILRDYAAGRSPLDIAAALNAEGVPGPRGGVWNHSTIAGSAARGTGILHNELYVGVRVWGRRTFVKDRSTGKRSGRDAATPPIRDEAPELRIVGDDLWARVRARHAAAAHSMSRDADGRRQGNGKRPKRFLSGLIRCGLCGGPMTMA